MTADDHDPHRDADGDTSGPPAGAPDEQDVARLLAEVGGEEPLPPEVRTRLDETLAALVRERREDRVVPLGRGRRSPWGRRLLVAAAVLGVVGVGGGLAGSLTGALDGSGSGDSGVVAAEGSTSDEGPAGSADDPRAASGAGGADLERATGDLADEAALRRAVRALAAPGAEGTGAPKGDVAAPCAVPRLEGGRTAVVRYDGRDAVLVVRRLGATLEGRVYDCDLGLLLDGVRIPAPSGPEE